LKEIYKKEVKLLNPIVDKEFLLYKNKKLAFDSKVVISYSRWVE
jgi:hypothetical protein